MHEIIDKKDTKIEDIMYEMRDKQVKLDSKISKTKCHYYLYDKTITHYDIGKSISGLIILL